MLLIQSLRQISHSATPLTFNEVDHSLSSLPTLFTALVMLPAAAKKPTYYDENLVLHVGQYERSILCRCLWWLPIILFPPYFWYAEMCAASLKALNCRYRLPGGTERVINTKSTTVVTDIIEELCNVIGVNSANEREEFSLYCIVEGETFTVPLAKDHYILDVTTGKNRDKNTLSSVVNVKKHFWRKSNSTIN